MLLEDRYLNYRHHMRIELIILNKAYRLELPQHSWCTGSISGGGEFKTLTIFQEDDVISYKSLLFYYATTAQYCSLL